MDLSVLKREVTPSLKEERELKALAEQVLRKIKVKEAVPMLGGSGAKQTWLRNTHDIDIYVKFSYHKYKERSGELSDILHEALKKSFSKISRLHGSRDYFQIKKDSYTFEIVPILDIKHAKEAKNITDVSHLHVEYVRKNIKRKKELNSEIRLAKQFAKANHFYGAESFIRGFSGYVLELLTIHYGSFMNLVKAASKWRGTTIIGSKKEAANLNISKRSCLMLLDPVQPGRNAAAAMSEEKYYDFIMACRAFLNSPSPIFFKEKPFDVRSLHKLGKVYELHVTPLSGKRDIVGAKLLKAFTFIRDQIKHHGFAMINAKWMFDPDKEKAIFVYVTNKVPLQPSRRQMGPPIENEKAVKEFKKKHKKVVISHGRLCAIVKREYTEVNPLIRDILKSPNVVERVKKILIVSS